MTGHPAPPIGLIAGRGQLPLLTVAGMRQRGQRVACVGLSDNHDPALAEMCDFYARAGIIRLGRWISLLRRWQVREAVLIGGVRKAAVYEPFRLIRQIPDWRAARLWYRVLRHDRRDQSILAAVADELAREGITLVDSTHYITEHMASVGVLGRHQPSAAQRADIAFALPILMQLTAMDVGQAMAVKDHDVIAVEAIEGTDAMIERAGQWCRGGGWTLLKIAGQNKDMRFDVPTVGVATIEKLKQAGGRCLALGAGQVIMADREKVIAAADRLGVVLLGLDLTDAGSPAVL